MKSEMMRESTTLYYREGSSDKIYRVAIEEAEGGFVVNFAFGRRGTTLQTGTKTQAPVPYEKAKNVFEKLVQSKLAKGYTAGTDGTPYAHTDNEGRDTGIHPQLCNPVEDDEVIAELLTSNDYWMEEKFDGKRILLRKNNHRITGINRKGLIVNLSQPVADAAGRYDEGFVLDGESIGDTLHVFDVLTLDGESLLLHPFRERREKLEQLLLIDDPHLVVVETCRTTIAKTQRYIALESARKEGVVFKRHDIPYISGRPASGGPWLKFKFTTTGSFIVSRVNERRSVGLELVDGKNHVAVGNVTIPANAEVPHVGTVIEVRYLYAYRGGSLFQPVFLGQRDDITPQGCSVRQLKYRADEAE